MSAVRALRQLSDRVVAGVSGVAALGAWTWLYVWDQMLGQHRFGLESFAWGAGVAALAGLVAGAFAGAGLIHLFMTGSRLVAAALLAVAVVVAPVLAFLTWIGDLPLIAVALPAVAVVALLGLSTTPRHLVSVSSLLFVGLALGLTCTLVGSTIWLLLQIPMFG